MSKVYGVPDIRDLGGGPWPRFVRIGLVEVGDEFRSVRVRCQEPRGFFISTFATGPLNQVLELAFASFVYLRIKDRGYFVFRFPINDDRRVRDGVLPREGIWSYGLNHGDMENWVDRTHALW